MEQLQSDHVGMNYGVVSESSYDWLRFQEEQQMRLVSLANSRSRQTSFLSMDSWSHKSLISRLWTDGVGMLQNGVKGAQDSREYVIEYSVFQPRNVAAVHGIEDEARSQEQFQYTVSNCIEAMQDLGIDLQRILTGSSGSYFVYGTNEEILGVFKPKDEEPYGPLSPKWTKWLHRTFFPCFFGRSCLIPNLGYICEAAASLLDRQLRTNLVPRTDTLVLDSMNFYDSRNKWFCGFQKRLQRKLGSFQLFLTDYTSAATFLQKYPLPEALSPEMDTPPSLEEVETANFRWTSDTLRQFRLQLEKLIILDYIMRNTDRGLDNWMIRIEESLMGWQVHVAAIDNGLSFPWKHPDEWRSYPYGWLYLPLHITNRPFMRETREHFLRILLSSEWWEQSYLKFHALFRRDAEFTERMWKKQWSVLKGQAFNVLETLKHPSQGPLELIRRTRCLVLDEILEVPAENPPMNIIGSAIDENLDVASSPMILSSVPEESILLNFPQFPDRKTHDEQDRQSFVEDPISELLSDMNRPTSQVTTKKVIVERLQICSSKPPVFTWC
ncbi:1-phosphatidylinositol 4-kinase LSB6 Ecym_6349 [Eremothecium cymbalariae DBVPG|uniref:Phosphatidylinositol 4-kinase n=1 Tax=Eremothecium cymbalariae (strain CBS 270.75 / DBVPG 7215 / KCTC 17166 / NRRL Y-17582) TaxID=931890 RepID=G8JUE5_ERECY|nr:hypothetical protein Ecym_6349 [Eremothecium cymbalariae DBVPG\